MKRFTLYGFFILWGCSLVHGQSIDINNDQTTHPVDLILNVSVDQLQSRAPSGLNIQVGSGSGLDIGPGSSSQQTDANGRAVFHIFTGEFQIQITGPGITPFQTTIQILRQESSHTENVIVHSLTAGASSGVSPKGVAGSVSTHNLKIPDKAQSEFKAGSKALDDKNFPEAEKRFKQAVAIYPDYEVAYNGLGVAEMSSNQTPEARDSFEHAIKIDDQFAEAYRNLARIALNEHKFDEMDDLLSKSLQTEPLNAWALTYAAYAELQTHKFDLAITHARAAHSVPHPGLASVHIVAANALEATQMPADALKEYKLYLDEDPTGRDAQRAKDSIKRLSSAPAN